MSSTSQVLEANRKGVKTTKQDLNNPFAFDDRTFDVVHSNQVIEHLYDTDNYISEIYRILKNGGYAIISTENLCSWHNIIALIFGYQPFSATNISIKGNIGNPFSLHDGLLSESEGDIEKHMAWSHLRLFSYFGFKDVFQRYGFKVEKIVTSGYYPVFGKFSKLDPRHGHWMTIKVRK